jgi:LmbE family N-acetylglucosaminyl deacetylase
MLALQFGKKLDEGSSGLNLLLLGAHCDDIEIGCGGTILRLLREYPVNHVKWVVFCSNPVREKEARNCAEEFLDGVVSKEIIIKDFRDGYLSQQYTEVKDFFEQLKQEGNPDLIFTHYQHDLHQDHRLLSQLAWNTFRNHLILEYEIPKYDGDTGSPPFFVVLDERDVKGKVRKLMDCYDSQRSKHWFDEETFVSILRLRGMQSAARYAEGFYCRKIIV